MTTENTFHPHVYQSSPDFQAFATEVASLETQHEFASDFEAGGDAQTAEMRLNKLLAENPDFAHALLQLKTLAREEAEATLDEAYPENPIQQ